MADDKNETGKPDYMVPPMLIFDEVHYAAEPGLSAEVVVIRCDAQKMVSVMSRCGRGIRARDADKDRGPDS